MLGALEASLAGLEVAGLDLAEESGE